MNTRSTISSSPWGDISLPSFGYQRVAVVLTGSAVTQVMPDWLSWAKHAAPGTEFRVILRSSTARFLTRHSIESRLRARVLDDVWSDELMAAHIELAEWAELILVYPATLDYASRLAHGITDSPSLLAAVATEAQVCIAPAFPPRSLENPIVLETLERLRKPKNFQVIDPIPGPSESSDTALAWVPPPFPTVLRRIEDHRLFRTNNAEQDAA